MKMKKCVLTDDLESNIDDSYIISTHNVINILRKYRSYLFNFYNPNFMYVFLFFPERLKSNVYVGMDYNNETLTYMNGVANNDKIIIYIMVHMKKLRITNRLYYICLWVMNIHI